MFSFEQKTAVITGGARGIGKELAVEALRRDMKVAILDREKELLQQTIDECSNEFGEGRVLGVACNVADQGDFLSARDQVLKVFGSVQVLINNAGIVGPLGGYVQANLQHVKETFDVNVFAPVLGVQAYVPQMMSQSDDCYVVTIASIAGLIHAPFFASYVASKHAAVSFAESLSLELGILAPHIRVGVVCPAWVKTDLVKGNDEKFASTHPMMQMFQEQMSKQLAEGDDPKSLALKVFEAMAREETYILPHKDFLPLVDQRSQAIREGKKPVVTM